MAENIVVQPRTDSVGVIIGTEYDKDMIFDGLAHLREQVANDNWSIGPQETEIEVPDVKRTPEGEPLSLSMDEVQCVMLALEMRSAYYDGRASTHLSGLASLRRTMGARLNNEGPVSIAYKAKLEVIDRCQERSVRYRSLGKVLLGTLDDSIEKTTQSV